MSWHIAALQRSCHWTSGTQEHSQQASRGCQLWFNTTIRWNVYSHPSQKGTWVAEVVQVLGGSAFPEVNVKRLNHE
jgi:hypothetical protein